MDSTTMQEIPLSGHVKMSSMASDASFAGDFATYEKRGKIRQWIEDIDIIDSFNSRNSQAGAEMHSIQSSEDERYGRTIIGSDTDGRQTRESAGLDPLLDDDSDFDAEDDFFVEAAMSALEKGKVSFLADDFAAADAYLREALIMIKELAKKHQSICDTWELRRMLGVCAFHVHSAAEAEQALVSVLENAPKNAILNEAQRLNVSETAHLLSQVYVKLGQLEKAYRYCEYALRGRRKVLGKSSSQSYDSLALTARILYLQKNGIRGEFFIGMIPDSDREVHWKKFAHLSALSSRPMETCEVFPEDAVSSVNERQAGAGREFLQRIPSPPEVIEDPLDRASMLSPPSTAEAHRRVDSLRPESASSEQPSAVSSEPGDAGHFSSVSPPTTSSPVSMGSAFGMLPSQDQKGDSRQLLQPYSISGRSHHNRGPSHDGSRSLVSLPAISEPSSPNGAQEQHEMLPQHLRFQPQRQAFLSELPGDSHYKQPLGNTTRISSAHDKRLSTNKLPPAPRSVPSDIHATTNGPVPMHLAQPSTMANDRDRLPSRVAQASAVAEAAPSPTVSKSLSRWEGGPQIPYSDLTSSQPPADEAASSQSGMGGASSSSSRLALQGESNTSMRRDVSPLPESSEHKRIAESYPFSYDSMAHGVVEQVAPPPAIAPDAQRADFMRSTWTPPIKAHPAQRGSSNQSAPSADDDAAGSSASPPAYEERWSTYNNAPSVSQQADRQSITSSNYSESILVAYSPAVAPQPVSSSARNVSPQEISKSRRKPSLLKAFRNNSSTSPREERNVSINYNGVRLTRTDIDSIKHEALTDAAIDFWQEHLEQDLLDRSTKFVLMRPFRAALLQESSINDPTNLKAAMPDLPNSSENTVHIFIPLKHPRNAHYSLLLVSPQDGVACHYDPRQPYNRKLAETLTARIASHLDMPLTFYDVADTPSVQNEKDSAVFVCMFMQHLVLKLQHTHVSQKVDAGLKCVVDAKAARKAILKVVEARKKSEKNL